MVAPLAVLLKSNNGTMTEPYQPEMTGTTRVQSTRRFKTMAKASKTATQKISRTEAIAKLKEHRSSGGGRIFSVTFEKRDGSGEGSMNARFSVKSKLKGGKLPYNAEEQALMTVFDVGEQGYRSLNLLGLKTLKIDGVEYTVKAS
jgi:hypothetical protein